MKALTWQGRRELSVDEVPDPRIEAPTDAIVQITSTAICGSDLHLYELLGPFIDRGDILGHEPMGVVVAVGDEVTQLAVGDRVLMRHAKAGEMCERLAEVARVDADGTARVVPTYRGEGRVFG